MDEHEARRSGGAARAWFGGPIAIFALGASACSEPATGNHAVETPPAAPAPRPETTSAAAVSAAAPPSASPIVAATATTAPTATAIVEPPRPAGARIYSKARFAWIQPQPRESKGWIGYLGLGGSVALKGGSVEAARTMGGGCDNWYAVEPRGYICAGDTATVDPDDPVVVALRREAPKLDSPWPYEYGESIQKAGAVRYPKIPSEAEQRKREWDYEAHRKHVEAARAAGSAEGIDEDLIGVDLRAAGVEATELHPFTPFVREVRDRIAPGSTVAWTRQFDLGGRTFLVASDQAVVPKDRVRPYPRSEFHGVELGGEVQLPIAFFRKKERPKYKRGEDGAFVKTDESWPRLGWVMLTGEEVKAGKQVFLATREPGIFVLADDATVAKKATELPFGLDKDPPPSSVGPRRSWVDVSVLGGWLVAYERDKPVYATLISPGRGGVPLDGVDPLETASTPTGTFRVDGKFATATMVSSTNDLIVHTEVQYVQNFHGPHALHGAYWHDRWGEPKSGGCVNLAPIDAKWVFEWSEPALPQGWHGLRSVPEMGPVTVVSVHR